MWLRAGQEAHSFWHQTPRHFQLVMRGVRERLESEAQSRIVQSYETGAFAGLAHHGKLKALKHYTAPQSEQAQTPEGMLAALKAIGSQSNMKVRRVDMRES